jgi:GNAT superfamily N-acetyltransferase
MRITPARATHLPELAALIGASPLLARYGVTRASARASLAEGLRARDLLLLGVERGEIVGVAWVVLTRALDRAAYLRLLLVADGWQRRGVGAALLQDAERRVRRSGSRHMILLVTTTNRRARSFYLRVGYRKVGHLPDFARPGLSESMYVKTFPRTRGPGSARER